MDKFKKNKNSLDVIFNSNNMYKLTIGGIYKGHFKTPADAMVEVEKWARPFKKSWVITDGFNRIYAQG